MPWFFRRRKLRTFTMEVRPVMASVEPAGSTSASVTIMPSSKETSAVNLSAGPAVGGELPKGISVSFNPPLGIPPFSSVMNVSTFSGVAPSTYPFLVVATGADTKQLATYTLIVRSGKPTTEKPAVEGLEASG